MSDANLFAQQEANRRHTVWLVALFVLFFAWVGFGGDLALYYQTVNAGPNTWHHTFGGGIWMAFLTPGSLLSFAVGKSDDGTRFYVKAGFAY